jgi:ABC-type branched-subunit amino acid transport system substrate-binding protein
MTIAALAATGLLAACSATDSGSLSPVGTTVSVGQALSSEQANQIAIDQLGAIKVPDGATKRGVNGKVITIGGVGTVLGASGTELFPGMCDGAKARFERANREGGVNGYTFDYVGCTDDGENPTRNRDAVQEMVESKQVFALVPFTSGVSNQGAYLNEKRVPYFGWGVSPDYCGWNDRQFGFSVTSAISCTTATGDKAFFSSVGMETYLKGTNKKPADVKVAFAGTEDHASKVSINGFKNIGTALGLEVVYAGTPLPGSGSPPLADYTPLALELVASGANLIAIPTAPGPLFSIIGALRANGYTGDIQMFFADDRLSVMANALDGVYAMTPNFGSPVFTSSQYDQIATDLKAIGSTAPNAGAGTQTSYAGADLLIQAIGKVKGDLTTEAVSAAINGGMTYGPLGNVMCQSTWPASHVVPSNCASLVRFEGATSSIKPVVDLGDYGQTYQFPLNAS